MRRDRELRGETGRVAARVRDLLGERGDDDQGSLPGQPQVTIAQRLAARLPVRLDPGRRAAVAVGLAVLVAAVLTGLWLMSSRPAATPVSNADAAASGSSLLVSTAGVASPGGRPSTAPSGSASAAASQVVVDVAGKVRHPGLYRLPAGSRVDDALRAAGGTLRGVDLSSLNLAAKLIDGQQIAVGRPGAAVVAPPVGAGGAAPGGSGATAAGAPVDLNTATQEQLEALPGIGPALGQRILDYRTEHGSFTSVDQLDDVSGIGTVIFGRLKPLVTV